MWFEGEGVMLRVDCVVCGLRGRGNVTLIGVESIV